MQLESKIGTTRRGIGPAYEDKIGRRSIRVMDLASESNLDQRTRNCAHPSQCNKKRSWQENFFKKKAT